MRCGGVRSGCRLCSVCMHMYCSECGGCSVKVVTVWSGRLT